LANNHSCRLSCDGQEKTIPAPKTKSLIKSKTSLAAAAAGLQSTASASRPIVLNDDDCSTQVQQKISRRASCADRPPAQTPTAGHPKHRRPATTPSHAKEGANYPMVTRSLGLACNSGLIMGSTMLITPGPGVWPGRPHAQNQSLRSTVARGGPADELGADRLKIWRNAADRQFNVISRTRPRPRNRLWGEVVGAAYTGTAPNVLALNIEVRSCVLERRYERILSTHTFPFAASIDDS
jgi:hypothetical protein